MSRYCMHITCIKIYVCVWAEISYEINEMSITAIECVCTICKLRISSIKLKRYDEQKSYGSAWFQNWVIKTEFP